MTKRRPATIVGLLQRLITLWLRRWWVLVGLVLVVIVALLYLLMTSSASVQVATFNIQDYPKSDGQAAGALELVDSLNVDIVGVQEITKPDVLDKNVELYLGEDWKVVHVEQEDVFRRLAILYDTSSLTLVDSWSHDETAIYEGGRATLQARFRTQSGRDDYLRVFVVHLKAFSDGQPIRRRQLRAIKPIVRAAVDSGETVVMVGDFNSTELSDRAHITNFADTTGLKWSSEDLECTAYWDRQFTCTGSSLDHILSTQSTDTISAGGACETVGCEPGNSCPSYVELLSDHCPIVAEF